MNFSLLITYLMTLQRLSGLLPQNGGWPDDLEQPAFSCENLHEGYYADLSTNCQSYHLCFRKRSFSYRCPVATLFNQKQLVCDHSTAVKCGQPTHFTQYEEKQGVTGIQENHLKSHLTQSKANSSIYPSQLTNRKLHVGNLVIKSASNHEIINTSLPTKKNIIKGIPHPYNNIVEIAGKIPSSVTSLKMPNARPHFRNHTQKEKKRKLQKVKAIPVPYSIKQPSVPFVYDQIMQDDSSSSPIIPPILLLPPFSRPVILKASKQELQTPLVYSQSLKPKSLVSRAIGKHLNSWRANPAFFIPSSGLALPQPSDSETARSHTASTHMTMIFKDGTKKYRKYSLARNSRCPKCHPAFLRPNECQPCVIIR